MTHPLAVIPLRYDGVDLNPDDYGIFFEIRRGLLDTPEVRGQDVIVPSADGRSPRNRRADRLRIVLAGHAMGLGDPGSTAARTSFHAKAAQLRVLFDPTKDPALLEADMPNGVTRTIAARPLPGMMWDERIPSEAAYVNIELESVDPDWSEGS